MTADQSLQPTKPELAILKLLWRKKSLSAREIADGVAGDLGWSYSTLRTVLERMHEKGLLAKRSTGGVNTYAAAVGKVALLGRMIQDFTGRVLELDDAPPAVLFAQSKLLTHEEIEELEKLLRKEENEQ
ncbi:MAG: BlaI/MecI/CopY family transcriptional regulator [Alphaproteobacteria bacterium]|nr:BlaI/MecI/CopY family transcriptional regulator [Alphaproteobacteria bacterium]